jgi:hypothetical protein
VSVIKFSWMRIPRASYWLLDYFCEKTCATKSLARRVRELSILGPLLF